MALAAAEPGTTFLSPLSFQVVTFDYRLRSTCIIGCCNIIFSFVLSTVTASPIRVYCRNAALCPRIP
ncbi:hypothetical protein BC629DRAFT_1519373 [Irpex lacteus]|nr:hypothetical protein BC629DRAFT_1519373 [Irpex lacteus]